MAGSNTIDVVTLHLEKVPSHEIVGNRSPIFWMMLMSVNSTENDGLPVDFQEAVLDFRRSETNTLYYYLIFPNRQYQMIQVRVIGIPFVGIYYRHLDMHRKGARQRRVRSYCNTIHILVK